MIDIKIEFNQAEINQIINLYEQHKSTRKVGEIIGYSKILVSRILKENNIEPNNVKFQKSELEIENVKNLYIKYNGNIEQIKRETGYKWETIRKYIIDIDRVGKRKYNYIDNIFEIIDTEEKAYWFGFIYADGCISDSKGYPCSVDITLQLSDMNHVLKFIEFIQAPHEVLKVCEKDNKAGVRINNKQMACDLVNNGAIPRKSLVKIFPNIEILPEYLYKHFIRGYFDGNGGICLHKDKYKSFTITICSTRNMLENIMNIFIKELNITATKISNVKSVASWGKSGKDALKVLHWLYGESNIHLTRKYEKYAHLYSNVKIVSGKFGEGLIKA